MDEILAPPSLLNAALSPNGQQLACLWVERHGEQLKAFVLLQPADRPRDPPTVVLIGDYDVQRLEWASDERLLIWVNVHKDLDGKVTGMRAGDLFFEVPLNRVLSMNLDGSQSAVLFGGQDSKTMRQEFDLSTVIDFLSDDPDHILMQAWDSNKGCLALYKVNTSTGEAAFFERGAQGTYSWFTQNGVPMVRLDANRRGTVVSMFTRAPGDADWKLYRKLRRDELEKFADIAVVGGTSESGVLLVSVQRDDDDTRVIRRFNLKSWEMGEIVASHAGRDIDTVFIDERSNLVAAAFTEDRLDYTFFDPALKAHYRSLAKFFKNDANVVLYDASLDHHRLILWVTSPTQPGSFWFFDTATGALTPLGETRPWLRDRLAPMSIVKVKARDGLDLPAYLTTPVGELPGPRPLVVFPHGGPEARDSYGYNNFIQAFAAKGWMVLQVNFRGSGGYGRAFADAGRKRWGVEMQNDVEDALAAVLATGKVDPNRVAICGASYGGYAALMGAVKTPAAYKAVVAIAGVTHLDDFVANARREDGPDSPVYEYWVKTIGDPVADKALLASNSPALRAREIQAPVLLIHGNRDGIVPVEQSQTMSKALKNARRPVKYVELKWVGHRDWDRVTTKTILTETIAHIEKAFA
ncbi:alpha/beta hydrolase family protein [Caulobacter sp. AP07]|uniref:alpha/beta hydrolase family protein n=1 Tax=Caulobacter sp. AP07 TaxID=1144304 RepID=UPI0002DC8432|nr:alpha/beta fold hydrolase [Caulobacter sp. AP07]